MRNKLQAEACKRNSRPEWTVDKPSFVKEPWGVEANFNLFPLETFLSMQWVIHSKVCTKPVTYNTGADHPWYKQRASLSTQVRLCGHAYIVPLAFDPNKVLFINVLFQFSIGKFVLTLKKLIAIKNSNPLVVSILEQWWGQMLNTCIITITIYILHTPLQKLPVGLTLQIEFIASSHSPKFGLRSSTCQVQPPKNACLNLLFSLLIKSLKNYAFNGN